MIYRPHTRTNGRRVPLPAIAVLVTAGAANACDGTAAAESAAVVRDSAGVTIVENAVSPAEPVWRVQPVPEVDIGEFEGAPEYQLFRVFDGLRLADGRIVIANSGTGELRTYAADGAFVRSMGGAGEGPGEFRGMSTLWASAPDSLMVADSRLRRIAVFDTAGRFARTITFTDATESIFPRPAGGFADGSMLVTSPRLGFTPGSSAPQGGARRDSALYLRYSPTGARLDSIGVFPDFERYMIMDPPMVMIRALPFGRFGLQAVCGDGFYYGGGDAFEVVFHSPTGAVRRIVRRAYQPVPVDDDAVARYKADELERADGEQERTRLARLLDDMPYPSVMPPYERLLCDPAGRLFIADYRPPWAEGPARWSVFDPDGRLLGAVEVPDGLRVLEFGEDYVLGVWRDELEIEHVRLHRLLKTPDDA